MTTLRTTSSTTSQHVDIFIIGGGINGVGIARDASGRGLRVALCDRGDLGGQTSSASSQIIHGGLRYLEHYEFSLVRKALKEREILLSIAAHLIKPLTFVMPHQPDIRPLWQLRLGLFLYDHLAKRHHLANSHIINLTQHIAGNPLKDTFKKACLYNDCWVDDARLVIENAKSACDQGAMILPYTDCISVAHDSKQWKITLCNQHTMQQQKITATVLINAAGPFVDTVQQELIGIKTTKTIRRVKGSHLIVPAMYTDNHAYLLQAPDKRIVFTIPLLSRYTIIGTTDVAISDKETTPKIDKGEITYLLNLVNTYFKKTLSMNDIIHTYSGIRPLVQDKQSISKNTRDYQLSLQSKNNVPPQLTVFGGKLTTYRRLAEDALNMLKPIFPSLSSNWTANTPLPGGNFAKQTFSEFTKHFINQYSWLPSQLQYDYLHRYGKQAEDLLAMCKNLDDLGQEIAPQLYEKELDYLCNYEWGHTVDDIIWRRTKLGLMYKQEHIERIAAWLHARAINKK
jgi:glycerol-3-phosphate dehydrogenase